jgi:hypothetical protein
MIEYVAIKNYWRVLTLELYDKVLAMIKEGRAEKSPSLSAIKATKNFRRQRGFQTSV